MIEVGCCVVHVLTSSSILAGTHQLIIHTSRAASGRTTSATSSSSLVAYFSFLLDDCHSIEIILSEIEVLSRLIFHLLTLQLQRQLLYFEIVHVVFLVCQTALMD